MSNDSSTQTGIITRFFDLEKNGMHSLNMNKGLTIQLTNQRNVFTI